MMALYSPDANDQGRYWLASLTSITSLLHKAIAITAQVEKMYQRLLTVEKGFHLFFSLFLSLVFFIVFSSSYHLFSLFLGCCLFCLHCIYTYAHAHTHTHREIERAHRQQETLPLRSSLDGVGWRFIDRGSGTRRGVRAIYIYTYINQRKRERERERDEEEGRKRKKMPNSSRKTTSSSITKLKESSRPAVHSMEKSTV